MHNNFMSDEDMFDSDNSENWFNILLLIKIYFIILFLIFNIHIKKN